MQLILYKNNLKKGGIVLNNLKKGGIVLKDDQTDHSNKLMKKGNFYDLLKIYVDKIKQPIFLISTSGSQYIKINKTNQLDTTKVIIELFVLETIKLHFSIFLNNNDSSNYPHITFIDEKKKYHIYLTNITEPEINYLSQSNSQHSLIIKLLGLTLDELQNINKSSVISSYIYDLNKYISCMKDILSSNNRITNNTMIHSINSIKDTSNLRSKSDFKKEKEREEAEKKEEITAKLKELKNLNQKYSSFIDVINSNINSHFSKKRKIETLIQEYNNLFNKKPVKIDIFLTTYMKEIPEKDINEILEHLDFIFDFNENVWIIYIKGSDLNLDESLNLSTDSNLKEYLNVKDLSDKNLPKDLPENLHSKIISFNNKVLELINNKSIEKIKQFELFPLNILTLKNTKNILKISTELDAKLQTLLSDTDNLKSNKSELDMKYEMYKGLFKKSVKEHLTKLYKKCLEYKRTKEEEKDKKIELELDIRKKYTSLYGILFHSESCSNKFIKRLGLLIKKELKIELEQFSAEDNLSSSY